METDAQNEDFQQLHRLITESDDLKDFLDGMSRHAAASLSRTTGASIDCAVTLHRHKRSLTVAASSDQAEVLDRIEQDLGHGPCLEALRTFTTVLLPDTRTDKRWPLYSRNLTAAGYSSVLGVPIDLGDTASACLNFFAAGTGVFTEEAIAEATVFTHTAGHALRLALRIITAESVAADLRAAMDHRTTLDLATGMIMTQNRCTRDEAFQFIIRASNNRNIKAHEVAQQIIRKMSGAEQKATHFED